MALPKEKLWIRACGNQQAEVKTVFSSENIC
jgi:hypothetical protein